MNYLLVKDTTHSSLKRIRELYEDAFPLQERRNFLQLLELFAVTNMRLIAVEDESVLIGFLIQWEFEKFNYIEHIAIDPLQRGKNYGSTIIKQITGSSQKNLLLEVEPEHDDISKKRILFYERLGMSICPFDYEQPPYRKNEKPFSMLMMSYPRALLKEEFEEYISIIKTEVYERWR